jgi:predicted transcriptional regulator of viral defense system
MKKKLGDLETQFFAYAQMRRLQTVRTGDLVDSLLRLAPDQERKLLSRLSRGGLIARVRQGLYLVPPQLPLGGAWTPSEALALNALMEDQNGQYQICGPNAFNRYGFDEQIPTRVYAYNNRISGQRTIGAVTLILIKVADERLGNTEEVKLQDGQSVRYSARVRTLVDAVYDWSRFNSLPRGYEWIRRELAAKRVGATELVKATLQYGDVGTIRRMGALLEREKADPRLLKKLQRALKPTKSLIPWIPTLPKRGITNSRWGVVVNEQK